MTVMAKRFTTFCLIEESLLAVALCFMYAKYPDRAESYEAAALIISFLLPL